ncbi:predicted protein [Candida tropicalis MYA-3404]|uniref:Uncharacterized protein n=1 Tax=Candida tropicalis (strain ATCC MYA-3404 / T1) TaxID=294747 RepID=C5M779_CANTT|nr:predicted protein [Candida tropicalis MYA-3404]EER34849.1 predicted protein [Candida tropicalis MYA-3404]KAG4408729.1 hypothetical protein JTP64_002035 [Candida tropicalis]
MIHDELSTLSNYKTKDLPLPPPPIYANEDSASSTETSTTETTSSSCGKEEISLSEYRERLLQRHKVYDPFTRRSGSLSTRQNIQLFLHLNPTDDITKPTTLKRIDQDDDATIEQNKTPTLPKFHIPAAHKSPFTPEGSNEALPSPNIDSAASPRDTTTADPEVLFQGTEEKNEYTDNVSFQQCVISPHQQEFLNQVISRNSQLEEPFEYDPSESDILSPPPPILLQEQEQQQEEEEKQSQLHSSNSIKRSLKKISGKLKKSTSAPNLKKSSSIRTFKTSVLPDLPKQDYSTYSNQSKLEDQLSTFTARSSTTSRTSPVTSPQYSFTPPPPLPPKSPQYSYTSKSQSINTVTNTPTITSSEFMASPDSPFWKYHILKFGKDLYLTTNPGMKHMYCRNAPGYFIEVISNDPNLSTPTSTSGYTLIFKDSSRLKDNADVPYMMISKKSQAEGGFFTFGVPRENFLNQGTIMKFKDETSYHGVSYKEYIDKEYFPYDNLRAKFPQCFKNFEVRDLHGVPWNIGSIPRVKVSKVNKLRDKISGYYDHSHQGHHEDELKFIGKRNIYFHQNFIPQDCQAVKYKEYEPKYVYGHDYGKSFPPVLAMFRPYENNMRKRMIQRMKNHSDIHGAYLDGVQDDYGTDTDKFYQGSDGLYYVKNTSDDLPDENKLGWITIYEDNETFGGISNRGMFDLVIGMTLAVGYDSCLTD